MEILQLVEAFAGFDLKRQHENPALPHAALSFAGDLGYTAATGANVLTVTRLSQAITFAPIPDAVATDPPFTLTATGGDSGNAVVFTTTSAACSVSGDVVTIEAAGTCSINADQAGNDNYDPAPTVTQAFNIAFATQTIVFQASVSGFAADANRITTKGFGDAKPSAPNTTAVGRAQNRRVEIVKQ